MPELFATKHWVGEFFLPGQYEMRFAGTVDYSPENGPILTYLIAGTEVPDDTDVLHGILDTGEPCTLFGHFSARHSGFFSKNGIITHPGKAGFGFFVIGDFFKHDDCFDEFDFSFTGMQEFFFPQGYKDLVKYSNKPLLDEKTPYGSITIGNNALFGTVDSDITTQIYSKDADALARLQELFYQVQAEFPQALFMLKKDIYYRIRMKLDTGEQIHHAISHISNIADLFALLIYNPVYPESISIINKAKPSSPPLPVYPWMALDKRTIDLSTKTQSHFHMPIKRSNIDFAVVLSTWLSEQNSAPTITSSIQNETGFRDLHSLHGELVLYATQLEWISHTSGEKKLKYEYPLTNYASTTIQTALQQVFQCASLSDAGQCIGDLRNEIAHVGKPKKLLNTLTMQELGFIARYLQLTIIGYLLTRIGIPIDIISAYQDNFRPV